ncbi:DinB family protein [Acuticoccus sp. MNP-M23]|nr:DinB family protein [Acuticoccus sp. MNP-M23]WMS42259.1 DinB family protein [Acuticoccus sp. MNP-M23]
MKPLYTMLANYNRWANARLYDAVAPLSVEAYRSDEGAFFKSLHGTLNHLVAADRIWLTRFTGEGDAPSRLDAIIAEDFTTLREEREATDNAYIGYVARLSDEALATNFTYTPVTTPVPVTQPLAPALLHAFNHQTHHRGQCHTLLTRLTGEAPSLDLIYYQRETGEGMD